MSFAATVLANTDYARCPERFARRDALTPHSSVVKWVLLPRFVLVRVLREAEAEVGFDVAEVYRAECLSRVTVGPTAVGRSEGGQDRVGRKSISRQAGQFRELVGQADGSLCGRSRCPVGTDTPSTLSHWPGAAWRTRGPGQAAPRFGSRAWGRRKRIRETTQKSFLFPLLGAQVPRLVLYGTPANDPESQVVRALTPRM